MNTFILLRLLFVIIAYVGLSACGTTGDVVRVTNVKITQLNGLTDSDLAKIEEIKKARENYQGFDKSLSIVSRMYDTVAIHCCDANEKVVPSVGFLPVSDSETGELSILDTRAKKQKVLQTLLEQRISGQQNATLVCVDDAGYSALRYGGAGQRKRRGSPHNGSRCRTEHPDSGA